MVRPVGVGKEWERGTWDLGRGTGDVVVGGDG